MIDDEYQKAKLLMYEIIKNIPMYSKTDSEYQLKVFTYIYIQLASMMEYDDDAYKCLRSNYCEYDRDYIIRPASDIRALARGKALCSGFSEVLNTVLKLVKIDAIRVTAQENHSWNQVCLDGVWYNCDLTNDYCFINVQLKCPVFLKSNSDFYSFKKYEIFSKYNLCEVSISNEKQEQLISEAITYKKDILINKEERNESVIDCRTYKLVKKKY